MKRRVFLTTTAAMSVMFPLGIRGQSQPAILPPDPEALQRWRDMKFGMFIHWGPVSLTGKEIGWSRGMETTDRHTRWQDYDQLYKQFNPTRFDADEWVSIAQDTGMKYMVLTSRHHDGFCLWDSAYTDYTIMNSPFQRDVLKELTDACKQADLAFGPYFSISDWRHPDYGYSHGAEPGFEPEGGMPDFGRFVTYSENQIREQIEAYGPYLVMWFDGEWEDPWTHEHGVALNNFVRRQQPDILINNRVDKGRDGMQGMFRNDGKTYAGDFGTPEQEIGLFTRDVPWETCMTIGTQWSWKPDDNLRSLQECVRTLIYTIGGDGNLLFNVGPMPDGRIEPRQVDRLLEMGAWVDTHSDDIFATRGGPYKPGDWGASTCKDSTITLFMMHTEGDGLRLPSFSTPILSVTDVSGAPVPYQRSDDTLQIQIEAEDSLATVVRIRVDGNAEAITPVDVA